MWTSEQVANWMRSFSTMIKEQQGYLSELDSAIGDGDHGTNMARGTTEIMVKIDASSAETAQDIFKVAAMAMISKTGGASGPLYGTAFMEMAKQVAITPDDIAAVIEAGLGGIKKRGNAAFGEKTMVDVWEPVIAGIRVGELTVEKIDELVEATKMTKATKGRASYLGERSIGHIDAGATSSGYFFKSMIEEGLLDG